MALNDLLISIYSQRPESEYEEHYFKLIEKLHVDHAERVVALAEAIAG